MQAPGPGSPLPPLNGSLEVSPRAESQALGTNVGMSVGATAAVGTTARTAAALPTPSSASNAAPGAERRAVGPPPSASAAVGPAGPNAPGAGAFYSPPGPPVVWLGGAQATGGQEAKGGFFSFDRGNSKKPPQVDVGVATASIGGLGGSIFDPTKSGGSSARASGNQHRGADRRVYDAASEGARRIVISEIEKVHANIDDVSRSVGVIGESAEDKRKWALAAEGSQVMGIAALTILYDPPVENCELRPYVVLKCENGSQKAVDSDEDLRFRWSRGQKRICAYPQCDKSATIQSVALLKYGVVEHMTYFCGLEHLKAQWNLHRQLMARKAAERGNQSQVITPWFHDDEDLPTPPASRAGDHRAHSSTLHCRFPAPIPETWTELCLTKNYTPTEDDVGRMLRLECAPVIETEIDENGNPKAKLGPWMHKDTQAVLPSPRPPNPRRLICTGDTNTIDGPSFKVLSYNILAPIYATKTIYPYCPMHALQWNYRRNNLLREITDYNSDIICLQEVQCNHFEEFFQPMLSDKGYDGIFKQKTRDVRGMEAKKIDGCAIFYKKDRFALMEQYHVEFNEAAKNMIEQQRQSSQHRYHTKKLDKYLRRLCKGNIALVLVLEEIGGADAQGRRRRGQRRKLCVANTHIYWDPEFADVKLWQTWVLCQELSKLVIQRDLPLLLCGDFNSEPPSSCYSLLSTQAVNDSSIEEVIHEQKKWMFPAPHDMTNQLPLQSAYSPIGEPKYTNYTGHFVGTLDYMWYTKNHLTCLAVLDVDSEEEVSKETACPNSTYSSDHISLLAEFSWIAQGPG